MAVRWSRLGSTRRLPLLVLGILAASTFALWLVLPYDNPALLSLRFFGTRAAAYFRVFLGGGAASSDDWLFAPPPFPVRLGHDVGFVIKTGYGTQDRVAAQLDALGSLLRSDDGTYDNVFVIADFAQRLEHAGQTVEIYDAIAPMMQDDALGELRDSERLRRYKDLTAALRAGNKEEAGSISRQVGWELDAMKFIPGLDMAYRKMPDKQWYVLLDDDTFLVKSSLRMILGHLDPSKPKYLGNAVGDYKGRFGHGGSSVILSRAAMSRLFDDNAAAISFAYKESLVETWGDKLLSTTLMKAGIYLDERFSHHFNGERPWMTRVLADRVCSPIVSFHGLAEPREMRAVGDTFRELDDDPLLWGRLWAVYGQPDPAAFTRNPIRLGRDHVGRADELTVTVPGVAAVDACADECERQRAGRWCLAWTWERDTGACHLSPWFAVGAAAPDRYSGLNTARVTKLMDECRR